MLPLPHSTLPTDAYPSPPQMSATASAASSGRPENRRDATVLPPQANVSKLTSVEKKKSVQKIAKTVEKSIAKWKSTIQTAGNDIDEQSISLRNEVKYYEQPSGHADTLDKLSALIAAHQKKIGICENAIRALRALQESIRSCASIFSFSL